MKKHDVINQLIKREEVDTNLISDGHHTFGELYEHRTELFITIARFLQNKTLKNIWRYRVDRDWFLLGINTTPGKQISYHLPISKWNDTHFAYVYAERPEYDNHTSADVLERLKQLL